MYVVDRDIKQDPLRRWMLSDRVFFACGACHILAHTFLNSGLGDGFHAIWIKPAKGFTGNHVVAVRDNQAFDYHGYSRWDRLLVHTTRKANRWWPGWHAELIELPEDALISAVRSREYDGLWLREPKQFLHDATPRAQAFIRRFTAP